MVWMAGLDTKKRFTVPHTYSKCMWDGKPFLQVPHGASDGREEARVRTGAPGDLFEAALDAEKRRATTHARQELRSRPRR